jgi:hypothetical protein
VAIEYRANTAEAATIRGFIGGLFEEDFKSTGSAVGRVLIGGGSPRDL